MPETGSKLFLGKCVFTITLGKIKVRQKVIKDKDLLVCAFFLIMCEQNGCKSFVVIAKIFQMLLSSSSNKTQAEELTEWACSLQFLFKKTLHCVTASLSTGPDLLLTSAPPLRR